MTEPRVDVARVGVEVPIVISLELRLDLGERVDRIVEVRWIAQPFEDSIYTLKSCPPGSSCRQNPTEEILVLTRSPWNAALA